mgnify:FL=1
MKLPKGEWDGAQPRSFVLGVLRSHGVEVHPDESKEWYELVDKDGDAIFIRLPNPILRAQTVYLYRQFGELHGFLITDLVKPRTRH